MRNITITTTASLDVVVMRNDIWLEFWRQLSYKAINERMKCELCARQTGYLRRSVIGGNLF